MQEQKALIQLSLNEAYKKNKGIERNSWQEYHYQILKEHSELNKAKGLTPSSFGLK